jgi:hypothetical protein
MTTEETCEVCGRVDHPAYMCWRVGHLINEATAQANPEYAMPVASGGWQIPASMVPPADNEIERLRALARAVDEFVSAAECQCCGGVPYCDNNIEKKAFNEKGRAMTEALRKVTP